MLNTIELHALFGELCGIWIYLHKAIIEEKGTPAGWERGIVQWWNVGCGGLGWNPHHVAY